MKKYSFIVAITCTLLLMGCASSGNQSLKNETEQSVAQKITENVTTKNDIKNLFGSPFSVSFTDGGNEIWTYYLDNVHADAINFIPVVGMFGSSSSGTRKQLVIMFDGNTVKKYSMSSSNISTKTGVFK